MGIKNAEFYADFESVQKVEKISILDFVKENIFKGHISTFCKL
jgi:hypothetical protein